jgi:transaldolase
MAIFLDSSDLKLIAKFHEMGVLRGVTTNPSIMLKEDVRGMAGVEERARAIAALVAPWPVSIEVMSADPLAAREQALRFASWAPNIVVKVTIHGPNGELDNLALVHELETRHDVRVNVTAMMSAQQCFLAALAGASYVSIFGGRVNNMGYNVVSEIRRLRGLLDAHDLKARIIVGSTREVLNVIEWLEAGAHIVTTVPALLEGMIVHPYSKETVQQFLRDAAAALGPAQRGSPEVGVASRSR